MTGLYRPPEGHVPDVPELDLSPVEPLRGFVSDYVREHSFDDAQCAACGTVRWEHVDHFLDALAPHVAAMLARARAEALREAADAWQTGGWASVLPPKGADRTQIILRMAQRGTQWLRERADRIGGAS